ncbi:hypothetical protein Plhal304r1_c045g0125401 [Plasmopara halstedii]
MENERALCSSFRNLTSSANMMNYHAFTEASKSSRICLMIFKEGMRLSTKDTQESPKLNFVQTMILTMELWRWWRLSRSESSCCE